jgi:hypothetical protein
VPPAKDVVAATWVRNPANVDPATGRFYSDAGRVPVEPPPASGDNADRINALLDDYTLPSIMTGLQYPADPVTTTTHEVRTNAELAAAVNGDGRRVLIYGPSNGGLASYNQFNPGTRNDLDIVMDNDATITGSAGWGWFSALRRIRWTGGNVNITSGTNDGWFIWDAEDVLFDNVRVYRTGGAGHIMYPGNRTLRFSMINSTVEFTASGSGIYYAMFSSGSIGSRGDWVFCNNRFIGEGPSVRLMAMGLRTAILGNYFSEFPNPASVRIHETNDKFWFARNVGVNNGGNQPTLSFLVSGNSEPVSSVMNDFLVEDNRLFAQQGQLGAGNVMRFGDPVVSNQDQATNFVIRNNLWSDPTASSTASSHGWYQFGSTPFVAENNLRVGPGHPSYETAPAASSFGAQR